MPSQQKANDKLIFCDHFKQKQPSLIASGSNLQVSTPSPWVAWTVSCFRSLLNLLGLCLKALKCLFIIQGWCTMSLRFILHLMRARFASSSPYHIIFILDLDEVLHNYDHIAISFLPRPFTGSLSTLIMTSCEDFDGLLILHVKLLIVVNQSKPPVMVMKIQHPLPPLHYHCPLPPYPFDCQVWSSTRQVDNKQIQRYCKLQYKMHMYIANSQTYCKL